MAITATLAFAAIGSATMPGKNGPLLVSCYVKGGISGSTGYLYTETLNGESKKLLGELDRSYSDPAVSPDGQRIVYSLYPGYRLWLGSFANPATAKAITPEENSVLNQESVFAPDGKSIYYSKKYFLNSGVFWKLQRYTIKTKKFTTFRVNSTLDYGLSDVSPNGRLVAYNRGGDDVPTKIRLLDTVTGKSHTVDTKASALSATFSPDGKWITYTAPVGNAWEVYESRLDGTKAKRLTRTGAINSTPFFSPDGKLIAFIQGTAEERKIGIITLKTGDIKFIDPPGEYAEIEQWLGK